MFFIGRSRYLQLQVLRWETMMIQQFLLDPRQFVDYHYFHPEAPELTAAEQNLLAEIYNEEDDDSTWDYDPEAQFPKSKFNKPLVLLTQEDLSTIDDPEIRKINHKFRSQVMVFFEGSEEFRSEYFVNKNGFDILKIGTVLTDSDLRELSDLTTKTRYHYVDYQGIKNEVMHRIMKNHLDKLPLFYRNIAFTPPKRYFPEQEEYWEILPCRIKEFPDKQVVWIPNINGYHHNKITNLMILTDDISEIEPYRLLRQLLEPGGLEYFWRHCRTTPGIGMLNRDQLSPAKLRKLHKKLSRVQHCLVDIFHPNVTYSGTSRLLLRLVRRLGAHIIRRWITDERVLCFYQGKDYYYNRRFFLASPQRAKQILQSCCTNCGKLILQPKLWSPVGVGIWRDGHFGQNTTRLDEEHQMVCDRCNRNFYRYKKREIDLLSCFNFPESLAQRVITIILQATELL